MEEVRATAGKEGKASTAGVLPWEACHRPEKYAGFSPCSCLKKAHPSLPSSLPPSLPPSSPLLAMLSRRNVGKTLSLRPCFPLARTRTRISRNGPPGEEDSSRLSPPPPQFVSSTCLCNI